MTTSKLLASLLGIGYIKPASGTWGSLFAGVLLFMIFPGMPLALKIAFTIIIFCIGWLMCEIIVKNTQLHDPHFIVIDEAAGMMIATILLDAIWWHFAIAFFLFRFFDIAKLWPASVFDKQQGGFGIMMDDVVMAVPALLFTQALIALFM